MRETETNYEYIFMIPGALKNDSGRETEKPRGPRSNMIFYIYNIYERGRKNISLFVIKNRHQFTKLYISKKVVILSISGKELHLTELHGALKSLK